MAKFNVDEITQLAEPIEIVIDGKEYSVKKVSSDLLIKVDALKSGGVDAASKQLAMLLSVDTAEFKDVDIRKVGKAIEYITTEIGRGISSPKNS